MAVPAKHANVGLEARIHELRGVRVMLSSDLAELYQVPLKALIQAVKRNLERFPPDFMFQLEPAEVVGEASGGPCPMTPTSKSSSTRSAG